jgi:tetratricopeptide (TPR) repeat protein
MQASQRWSARQDRLLFNQGVLAYKAGNLPQAMDFFRRVSQQTSNRTLRTQSLYNLSLVLLTTQDAPGAVELLKEALRLEPGDRDAKFMLEQIYQAAQQQQRGDAQQASNTQSGTHGQESSETLQQAPGESRGQGEEGSTAAGQGRSNPRQGI